jgi:hypothetical protein
VPFRDLRISFLGPSPSPVPSDTEEAWGDPDFRKMYFEAIKWSSGMTGGEYHIAPPGRLARHPVSEIGK